MSLTSSGTIIPFPSKRNSGVWKVGDFTFRNLTIFSHSNPDADAAKELISVGLAPVNDAIDPIETAALLSATRAIMNMHEFITRN